jgi:hypothetical protein
VDLYIHSCIGLHGIVLNYLSTGTTLTDRISAAADKLFNFNFKKRLYKLKVTLQKLFLNTFLDRLEALTDLIRGP